MFLANGSGSFPDALVDRHPDFVFCATANTTGAGASAQYIAAERIDAATVNRFAFIEWNYDTKLEYALAGDHARSWVDRVIALRLAHKQLGHSAPDILISPRSSFNGANRLRRYPHTPFDKLEALYIWQGCSAEDRDKVLHQVGR
jgi:hypothetical protein